MSAIRTILFATDFSDCSEAAFPLACSLARDQRARLILLHVVPSREPAPVFALKLEPTEDFEGDLKSYQDEMRARLARLRPPDPNTLVERVLKEGDPAAVILRTANETACELIIMGTHGRTGAFRQLMGSVADQVSRQAPCPVLTFRIGGAVSEPAKACLAGIGEKTR